ncbi:MAG: putative lipid II flippase FtsW [Clostridia bacterium]|nr:putative lipid II flippase FtsW [Clostridia bacterium]
MAKVRKKTRRMKRGGIDMALFCTLMIMLAFGLIMVFSASSPSAYYNNGDQFYYIKKQLIWMLLGFVAMYFFAVIDINIIKKYAGPFCAVTLVLMLLVPIIGVSSNGAKRWLGVGPITFQPSEIAKFALILYLSKRLAQMSPKRLQTFKEGIFPLLFIVILFAGAMILQDHLSAAIVTFVTMMILLVAGGVNIAQLGFVGITGIACLVPFAFLKAYRLKRLMAFVNPFAYVKDIGWQIVQGLYAIGSGGLFGRGLGQSRQKFLYVPEAHNDYIYAILCEELGFIGALIVAVLFVVFLTRCVKLALATPDKFMSLTVFGISTLITLQYVINIGVVTSSLPNTGMQLPFFSAGGSSLVFLMSAMGIVFNISRYSKKEKGLTSGDKDAA